MCESFCALDKSEKIVGFIINFILEFWRVLEYIVRLFLIFMLFRTMINIICARQ